jgi:hypothetical protein
LSESMNFFNTKLFSLVRKLNGRNDVQFKAMSRNFLFYQKCIDKENIKSILASEFSGLKVALKLGLRREIAIPAENLAFLAGALYWDRSSLFGLPLIADQTPEFIGYFMTVQVDQVIFLQNRDPSLKNVSLHAISSNLLYYIFKRFSNGEDPAEVVPSPKFKVLKGFINNYSDIICDADLIDLKKQLFHKISLL